MKAYNAKYKGSNTKGHASLSGPHANRKNKLRGDKKAARNESKAEIKKEIKDESL